LYSDDEEKIVLTCLIATHFLPICRYPPFPNEPFKVHDGSITDEYHQEMTANGWPCVYNSHSQQQPQSQQQPNQQQLQIQQRQHQHQQQFHQHQKHQQSDPHLIQPQQTQPHHQPPSQQQQEQLTSWEYLASGGGTDEECDITNSLSLLEFESSCHTTTTTSSYLSDVSGTQEQPEEDFTAALDLGGYSVIEQGTSENLDGSTGYISDQSVTYDETLGIWADNDDDSFYPCKKLRSDDYSSSESEFSRETSSLSLVENDTSFDEMIDQLLEMGDVDLEDINRPLF